MDAAGIITGAVVALVSGMLIPFVTEQWSLWSKQRSDMLKMRRGLVAEYIDAQTNVHIRTAEKILEIRELAIGGSAGPDEADDARIRAARQQLRAMFTTSDRYLAELFTETAPDSPHATPYSTTGLDMILATWAAGRNWRAKWAGRKLLLEIRERKQRAVRQPKDDATASAGGQPD